MPSSCQSLSGRHEQRAHPSTINCVRRCSVTQIFAAEIQITHPRPSHRGLCHLSFNKAGEWLASKDEEEVYKILQQSRKEVGTLKKKFKERNSAIMEARRQKMLGVQDAETARQRKESSLEKLGHELSRYGLWCTHQEVDKKLDLLDNNKEKEQALELQLQYRQHVMKMGADKGLFRFSVKTAHGRPVHNN